VGRMDGSLWIETVEKVVTAVPTKQMAR
jgi:hypothetical protein